MPEPEVTAAPAGPTLTMGLANFAPAPSEPRSEPGTRSGSSGLRPPTGGVEDLRRRVVERARIADEAGIDRLVVVDHVVMGENIDAYDGGRFPTGPDGAWLEPLTVLSLLAGVTTRVRLSTGIIIAALRPPAVLAKTAATLDVLSGGRLDLGVGVGWQREEYEAVGLDFARRGDLLDDALAACRALWQDSPASYESEHLRFKGIWCEPKPAQPGGVPIWVSGRINRRTLARIVRFGSGWIPWGEHIRDPVPGIGQIRQALEAAGRDPTGFGVRAQLPLRVVDGGRPDLDRMLAPVPAQIEAGVTDFNLAGRLPDDPEETADLLAEVVTTFRRAVGR